MHAQLRDLRGVPVCPGEFLFPRGLRLPQPGKGRRGHSVHRRLHQCAHFRGGRSPPGRRRLRQRGSLPGLQAVRPRNPVVLELFTPAPESYFKEVAEALPNFNFEISPESHDENVRRASGKFYGNEAMENSIRFALDHGCSKFDVFFMIGIPRQTSASVMETIDYCGHLLKTFGRRLNPFISPLAPFLDPGSIAFENAEEVGYRVFCKTLEDYRQALLAPSWKYTLSYETRWMTREEIVDSTYQAGLRLNRLKEGTRACQRGDGGEDGKADSSGPWK